MRVLADENFSGDAVAALRACGHDVAWIRVDAPGISDEEVLARAVLGRRVLLTFDKDFGELAWRRGLPADCGIVLFRAVKGPPAAMTQAIIAALDSRNDWPGHFSVVTVRHVRMRPLVR